MAVCKLCQGTGKIVLYRSWFPSDGYSFGQCSPCDGSGDTVHQASSGWQSQQKRARTLFGIADRSAAHLNKGGE